MTTIAPRQARKEEEIPLPRAIQIGDKVRLYAGAAGPYLRMYGAALKDKVWTVTFIDHTARKRLYVDDTPSAIYAADARLAYDSQSKARRDQLTKMGVKLR